MCGGWAHNFFKSIVMQKQNQNQKNQRQVKVYPKYQKRAYKDVIVPEIRICGSWLQASGFQAGQVITISVEENRLVITSKTL